MKVAAVLWCFLPWIVAAGTSLVGLIDHREAVRLTSLLFFMVYPALMAGGLIVAKSEAA